MPAYILDILSAFPLESLVQDRINRMRELRQQALAAFNQINVQVDALKDIVGAWGNELSGLGGELSTRAKGRRPNREPGKYVKIALKLAAKSSDGRVEVDAVTSASPLTKTGRRPAPQNVMRALLEGSDLVTWNAKMGGSAHPNNRIIYPIIAFGAFGGSMLNAQWFR